MNVHLNEPVSKTFVIFIFLALGGLIGALLYQHLAQQHNLKLIKKHNDKILKPLLQQHEKFKNIQVGGYTGNLGNLMVTGFAESAEDLNELKNIVRKSNPPRPVLWLVRVNGKANSKAEIINYKTE